MSASAGTEESADLPDYFQAKRAIVVVDVVESVRLIEAHETDVIARWRRFVNEVRTRIVPQFGGRLIKSLGDGMLLEFDKVVPAVNACNALMKALPRYNEGCQPSAAIRLRAGVNDAEVTIDQLDVYGAGVNLAARLASLAGPDEMVVSADVWSVVQHAVDIEFEDMGECYVKNIERPLRAYRSSVGRAWRGMAAPPAPQDLRPMLAVLSLQGQGAGAAIGSLVADELVVHLSALGSLDVMSRLSTRTLPGNDVEPLALLQRLGATYVVSGSCLDVGDRLVVTLELSAVKSSAVVWSTSLATSIQDLVTAPALVLQEPCSQIMRALEACELRQARSWPIASLRSYTLLIGGVSLMHRLSESDFKRSRELLDAVVERVPRHPDAYAWLAKWHILHAHQGWAPDIARSQMLARDTAHRALDRDDSSGLALTIAGMVKTYVDRDLPAGEALYRRAIDLNPNDALAWLLKGTLHGFKGEGEAAVNDTRRALALSPADPMRYYFDALAAGAAASAGLYEDAVTLAERSLRANRMHASTLRVLIIALAMQDRAELARPHVNRLLEMEPTFSVSRFIERAPGAAGPLGHTFADALRRAGVPP